MDFSNSSPFPEGVISFLDTDLYKLTMQCAVMKYFKDVPVTYSFTNRTPEKKLSREAFQWLEKQVQSKDYEACQWHETRVRLPIVNQSRNRAWEHKPL